MLLANYKHAGGAWNCWNTLEMPLTFCAGYAGGPWASPVPGRGRRSSFPSFLFPPPILIIVSTVVDHSAVHFLSIYPTGK